MKSYSLLSALLAFAASIAEAATLPAPNLKLSDVSKNSASVSWTWSGSTSNTSGIVVDLVNLDGGKGASGSFSKSALSAKLSGLTEGTRYEVIVTYNGSGSWKSKSSSIQFTTLTDQTLVTDLAAIMRANKWTKGADLNDYWFASSGKNNTSTISMSWVLGFSRAKSVYDTVFTDKKYASSNAQKSLVGVLSGYGFDKKNGAFTVSGKGDSGDACYYQYVSYDGRSLDACWSGFDDLDVALNKFTFRVVADGEVKSSGGRRWVYIYRVGVYARDSYDFSGSQPLGSWNKKTNYAGCDPLKGTYISNQSFRDYRTKYSKGKDFLVYSDIKWTTLSSPSVFEFK